MLLKYLIVYSKTFVKLLEEAFSKILSINSSTPVCDYVKPGIFACNEGKYIVALYKVKNWSTDVHTLTQLDYVYGLRRFLELFHIEGCESVFLTDVEYVDADDYMSKLNRKLQMKLVELELDKSNVRLRDYVEKLLEIRKKVLMGIRPIKTSSLVALVCRRNVNLKDIEGIPFDAKNLLNLHLESVLEHRVAEAVINFCRREPT
ncbi:MAG: hypothetical protein QXZ41_04450 [Ignisphaera sp.]|uniref:Uncharacterized protein n=1 Tax=Ignisphaera aggregans TaxID=334771 RepID=A0A832CXB8_9CREN